MSAWLQDWMPPVASAHGAQIDNSLAWVHWLMAILFVGWISFFFFCLWRFRRSKHPAANHAGAQSHASSWLGVNAFSHFAKSLPFLVSNTTIDRSLPP